MVRKIAVMNKASSWKVMFNFSTVLILLIAIKLINVLTDIVTEWPHVNQCFLFLIHNY